jgi:hypothetical protein
VGFAGRTVRSVLLRRVQLEAPAQAPVDEDIRMLHESAVEMLARELAAGYIESARSLREPADSLLLADLEKLDLDAVVQTVVRRTVRAKHISEAFREHAETYLEEWWYNEPAKRRVIEVLDKALLLAPAGIAGVLALHTAGIGAPEAMVFAAPLIEQITVRMVEYQFGDRMFNLLEPWRKEQQAALESALLEELTLPALRSLSAMLDPLEGELMDELRRWQSQCLRAS